MLYHILHRTIVCVCVCVGSHLDDLLDFVFPPNEVSSYFFLVTAMNNIACTGPLFLRPRAEYSEIQ